MLLQLTHTHKHLAQKKKYNDHVVDVLTTESFEPQWYTADTSAFKGEWIK